MLVAGICTHLTLATINSLAFMLVTFVCATSSHGLLMIAAMQDGLWWIPLERPQQDAMRRILLLVALTAALAGLEGRVLFRAFGQYLGLQPPWSYVVVSFALYGFAALVVLHMAGCPASC